MFDVMSMFAHPALNRMLQPMLTPGSNPNMFLSAIKPEGDPWAAMRQPTPQNSGPAYQGPVTRAGGIPEGVDPKNPPLTRAAMLGVHDSPAEAERREKGKKPGFMDRYNAFTESDRGRALNDFFTGLAIGSTPNQSLAGAAQMMATGRNDRKGREQQHANVEWLMRNGYDETSARAIAGDGQSLTAAIKSVYESRQPKYGFSNVGGDLVRYDERGNGPAQVIYDSPDAKPMSAEERARWGIPDDDRRPYYMDDGKPHAVGGPGVNVTLSGERAYDSAIGTGYAKRFLDIQNEAQAAGRALNSLDVMSQAMTDPNFYSGAASGSIVALKRYASALGLPGADGIESMEQFNAAAKQAALESMGGSLGTGFSNADRDFVLDQVPNLQNTPQGNAALIDIQRKFATRRQQIGALAREYAAQNDNRLDAGFEDFVAKWAEQNPLFPSKPTGSGRGSGTETGRQRARNPQTGEVLEWDGTQWGPVR